MVSGLWATSLPSKENYPLDLSLTKGVLYRMLGR